MSPRGLVAAFSRFSRPARRPASHVRQARQRRSGRRATRAPHLTAELLESRCMLSATAMLENNISMFDRIPVIHGSQPASPGGSFVGQFFWNGSGFKSFCVEGQQSISPGLHTFPTVTSLSASGLANADLVEQFWRSYGPTTPTGFTSVTDAAAFQLGLWELISDGVARDLKSGSFRVGDSASPAVARAASWLNGTGTPAPGAGGSVALHVMQHPTKQDQVIWGPLPPPSVSVKVTPTSVTEDGSKKLTYEFTASPAPTAAITVNYRIGGSATAGSDFTGLPPGATTGTITIPAGSTSATLTIVPTADTLIEPDETLVITLQQGDGYAPGTSVATGTILNDDLPAVTLAVSPASVTEDGTTNLVYTFTRTGPTTSGLTVNYGITGTADGADYSGATPGTGKTISFAAGSATATVTIDPKADTEIEFNETVILTLASGSGYTFDTTRPPATGTIENDDFFVDLDVDSDNDGRIDPDNGPAGTDDPIEEAPLGRIIFVNSDDDNRNGIADLLDGGGIAGEDDLGEVLLALTPSIGPAVGTLIVTYDETVVRLYKRPDRSGGIVSGGSIPADASVYAEGRIAGTSLVTVTWTVGGLRASDTIRLTVQPYPATIDVDVDSDNNNDFGPPDRSEWEDTLENHEYAIGKLIMLDNPQRTVTPVWLRLPTDLPAHAGNVRVRIDWNDEGPAGSVRLWNRAVIDALRNPAPADEGGNRIFPGSSYKLSALNYDATTGRIVIYAEGIKENAALKTLAGVEAAPRVNERIRGTLVVNGDDSAFDEVKYIVANEDSFYHALHTRQEVRNALASRGVYTFVDLPKFSLERKSGKALGAGDSDEFPLSPDVPGFKAMVYQDYITGDRQYVLTFGGTDDLSFSGGIWDGDWNNNLRQAIGWQAPQFMEAMKIANDLAKNPNIPQGHLVVTGHSLGGGLASAAAVVAGANADTFNASWLSPETLLTSKDNGTPLRLISINPLVYGYELYPGALDRLYTARDTIDAYFVDYDILNRVQQVTGVVLDKLLIAPVGSMTKLDSPYDVDIWVAGLPSFGTVAATVMLRCHSMNVVLYGLLVKEGSPTVDMLGYSLDDLRR